MSVDLPIAQILIDNALRFGDVAAYVCGVRC